ncbi:hypothetical protein JCM5296_001045 [Sporobolomyces johnsonii]
MSGLKLVCKDPAPSDFCAAGPGAHRGFTIDFEKKVYVVTGGNRGLGHGISEALLQANATLAIIFNTAKNAHEVASELEKKWGNKVKAYQCNVGDPSKVKSTFAQIEKELGPICGLAANAGISVIKPALELTADDFHKVFDVNVLGVFNTAQAVGDLWIKRKHKGSIVVVSSMSDTIAFYNSSKGAVSNLTRCLAAEWAPHGIRVNNLCPGFIETDQTAHMDPTLRAAQCADVPLGRFSRAYEQATQVVMLLSPYTSYQTGSSVYVDGACAHSTLRIPSPRHPAVQPSLTASAMHSRPSPTSSTAPPPDPTPHDPSVAASDEARAASSSGGNGAGGTAGAAGETPRVVPTSKDDQQISQILAEMSQQQHSPPMTTRSKRSTASPAASTPPLAASTSTFPPPPHASYPSAYAQSSSSSAQREPSSMVSTARGGPPLYAHSLADPATSTSASPVLPDQSTSASANPDPQAEEYDELDALASDTKPNGPAKTTAKGKGKGRGRGKSEERQGMNDVEWERSRKDNHKEVERRRRETINAGISSLAALLPPLSPSDPHTHTQSPTTAPSKLNKGLILSRAAEYIEALKAAEASNIERWTLEKLLSDQALGELRSECERLRREAGEWEREVAALRERVRGLEAGEAADGLGLVNAVNANGKRAAEAADGGEQKRLRPGAEGLS